MEPAQTARVRASIVARARFIEDLVCEQAELGVGQYVILGAGLDSFAQRRPEMAGRLRVFELDQPEPQAWRRQRFAELGLSAPDGLLFVPVDFEGDWWGRLIDAGFDPARPAVVVSTGVVMYLTRAAVETTLDRVAALAAGSSFVVTFLLPLTLVEPEEKAMRAATEQCA